MPRRRATSLALAASLIFGACASGGAVYAPRVQAQSANTLQTGVTAFQEGRYADAEAVLRGIDGVEALAYLAASLAKQKRYEEAEGPANAALAVDAVHAIAVAALGEALVGQKKLDEAVARMGQAIEARKDLAYAYYWRGQAFHGKKLAGNMAADFETFLKLAPQAPEAVLVKQLLGALRS
jgi:tetratricopeptide (TPR) repeat protein